MSPSIRFFTALFLALVAAAHGQNVSVTGLSTRLNLDADGAWLYLTLDPSGGTRTVYITAAGPGLTALGISGGVSDPQLDVWDSSTALVVHNDNRADSLLQDPSYSVTAQTPKDAGVKLTLAPGTYTIHVSGVGGATGLCVAEIKDTSSGSGISSLAVRARLENDATLVGLTFSGTGNINLAGFLSGPNLPVTNPMTDPRLRVSSGTRLIGTYPSLQVNATQTTRYRTPAYLDSRNAGFVFLWTYDSANPPPAFEVSDETGGKNGMFLLEIHNHDITTTRPGIVYVPPAATTVADGSALTLKALVGGEVLAGVWQRNGVDIAGSNLLVPSAAFVATYTDADAAPTDAGEYRLKLTTSTGTVYSLPATVTVQSTPPAISAPPQAVTTYVGTAATLSVAATGSRLSYQWFRNGVAIPGATSSSLTISSVSSADTGAYTVSVSNSAGQLVSPAAQLTAQPVPTRLTNLAVRALAGEGDRTLIVGFSTGGGRKSLTTRAVGPGLAAYGVNGFLADPQLRVMRGSVTVATNDNWSGDDGRSLGGFPLATGSKDSVISTTFDADGYTAQVNSIPGATGEALVEVYDADQTFSGARLTNLSSRAQLDAGQRLIVGFTLSGTASRTVLLRAVGPTLATFGVGGAHPDPQMELYDGKAKLIATNDNWQTSDGAAFGAFPLTTGSKDAVLVQTLPPDSYTLHVLGTGSTSGIVLVELYDSTN